MNYVSVPTIPTLPSMAKRRKTLDGSDPIPPGAIEMENADPLQLEDGTTELDVETV